HTTQAVSHRALDRSSTMAVSRAADDCCGDRLLVVNCRAGIDFVACGTPCVRAGIAAAHGASRDAEPRSRRRAGHVSQVACETRGERRLCGVGKLERFAAQAIPPARRGQAGLALFTPE